MTSADSLKTIQEDTSLSPVSCLSRGYCYRVSVVDFSSCTLVLFKKSDKHKGDKFP